MTQWPRRYAVVSPQLKKVPTCLNKFNLVLYSTTREFEQSDKSHEKRETPWEVKVPDVARIIRACIEMFNSKRKQKRQEHFN